MASTADIIRSVIRGHYQKELSRKTATDKLAWAVQRLDRDHAIWVWARVHDHKLSINAARVLALMAYCHNCGGHYSVGSFRECEPELFNAQVKLCKLRLAEFDNEQFNWIGGKNEP